MSLPYERVPAEDGDRNVAPAYPPPPPWGKAGAGLLLCSLLAFGVVRLGLGAARGSMGGTPYPGANRLAVCYSGQVGSLLDIYEQNLQNLREFDPDFASAFYLDLQDNYTLDNVKYESVRTKDELKPVFDAMEPVVVRTFLGPEVERPSGGNCYARENMDAEHYSHNFLEFHGVSECYKLLQDVEKEKGIRYDWFLRLQPNMEIKIVKPPPGTTERVHMSGAAAGLVPRSMAKLYFSTVEAFYGSKCRSLDAMGVDPCKNYSYPEDSPECLLVKWLKRGGTEPSNSLYVRRRAVPPKS